VVVNGVPVNCGTWNSAVANPSTTTTGGVVQLSASGSGPNASAITYAWTASSGTIDTPSAATANFTCPATPGQVTITLVVGDGPIPAGATCPASATTTTLAVTCTGTAPDAGSTPDTGTGTPDTGTVTPDTGAPDTGPQGPCTTAGQSGCVKCLGNADGVCSPTEAAFLQKDINAGHASTQDCYSCLWNNSCLNDTQFSDTNHECGDLAAASVAACTSTLSCIISTGCANNDIQDCFCGADNPGNSCQTAANPDGACKTQEIAGLGVSDAPTVLKNLTDTTRPAGMANQIFSCAKTNSCAACLH